MHPDDSKKSKALSMLDLLTENSKSKSQQKAKGLKRILIEYDSEVKVQVAFRKGDEAKHSCEWLLKEGVSNLQAVAEKKKLKKDFSKIVAFTTKSKNYLIDYWVTLPQKNLSIIEDGTVLVPYFKTIPATLSNTETKDDGTLKASLNDFEFITLLGKGGFSQVFLGNPTH